MNNITDTTNRPFDSLPAEATANILSFVDVKDHESVAEVCKLFKDIVNSGAEEGKNAREYLLGKVDKIDLTITKEDLQFLMSKGASKAISTNPQLEHMNESDKNLFFAELLEILAPSLDNINPEMLGNFKKVALDNIKEFISQDAEIINLKLAQFVQDPNSQESQAFIKDLALKMLEKFLSITERETVEKLGLRLPTIDEETLGEEASNKMMALVNKYAIQPQETTTTTITQQTPPTVYVSNTQLTAFQYAQMIFPFLLILATWYFDLLAERS